MLTAIMTPQTEYLYETAKVLRALAQDEPGIAAQLRELAQEIEQMAARLEQAGCC